MRSLLLLLVACSSTIDDVRIDGDASTSDPDAAKDASETSVDPDGPLAPGAEPVSGTRVAVAVGFGGKRMRSEDGVAWTDYAEIDHDGGDDINLLRGIGFGGGLFVAVGGASDGLIMTSPDGRTWSAPNRTPSSWLGGVAYLNGRYVTAGGNGLRMHSTDAVTWTVAGEHQQVHYRNVAGNAAIVVAAGHTTVSPTIGIIATTSDGITWTERRRGGQQYNHVVFGNGVFVAAGHAGKIARSTDGISWAEVELATTGRVELAFTGVDFIASIGDRHYRSTTAAVWTSQAAVKVVHAAFGGRLINLGWPAQIHATQNLSAWTDVFHPGGTGLTRLAEGIVP